jgi:hypothetical protein
MLSTIANVLTTVIAVVVLTVGVFYLLVPRVAAPYYGVPVATPWLPVHASVYIAKGLRDIMSGLLILVLFVVGDRQALGWILLVFAAVPLGDTLIVLRHHGSRVTAFSAHFSTGLITILTAVLVMST